MAEAAAIVIKRNPDKDLQQRRKSMVCDKDQNRVSFCEDWEFIRLRLAVIMRKALLFTGWTFPMTG